MATREQFEGYLQEVKAWGEQIKDMIEARDRDDHNFLLEKVDTFISSLQVSNAYTPDMGILIQNELEDLYREVEGCLLFERELPNKGIPIGEHKLPPLPYRYNALEPVISDEIMRLHHLKHHKSYVDGLNKAEKMMQVARETGDFKLLKHWEREAAFHGSGHYLHTIFWSIMSPKGGGRPNGRLLEQIIDDFGSFESFKKHFTEAAKQVEGVGWAILVWSPRSHRLEILQAERHQFMTQWDTIPLLVLDVWEHAYYLQYKNERAEYIKNWWNIVNWKEVEDRFQEASKLKWKPF